MIIYQSTKAAFVAETFAGGIDEVVQAAFKKALGHGVGPSELSAWRNSLTEMAMVLNEESIPGDAGVGIEFNIPQTGKRIDFILTGCDSERNDRVVIVELKQWQQAKLSDKDGVVSTFVGGSMRECSHPSYQAWSYATLLEGFNEAIYGGEITLQPCAYLHNYLRDDVIAHDHYAPYVERAPLFLKGRDERAKLQNFIKEHVRYGDKSNLLFKIENGRIRPSKMLADSLAKMMGGKQEFVLIDDQKVVYETALSLARHASSARKKVLIIAGGPGTGKTVVAINLLSKLLKEGQNCRYVSKNAAPREVFHEKLTGEFRATYIKNLFSGSGAFLNSEAGTFNTLIIDEAHRLNEKSGLYANLGENQIKEIINAADCSIFFIDEDQRVTLLDSGTKQEIQKYAAGFDAEVVEVELESQFRCNGSDGYLSWLDNTLGVRSTANTLLSPEEFDFRIVDSPATLHRIIVDKNMASNKARVVAGYCWNWVSKKEPSKDDIEFPEFGFRRKWNLSSDGGAWIMKPNSVEEIGCIHTCQGLEVDYIGVIVGSDFVVRDGEVQCDPSKRAATDRSLRGWKSLVKADPVGGLARLSAIIKNTYRTLMTRGLKGCYVYFTDPETAEYFRSRLSASSQPDSTTTVVPVVTKKSTDNVIPFRRIEGKMLKPFKNAVPLIDLKFAAGAFSNFQSLHSTDVQWVELPDVFRPAPGVFVAQVIGESMNRRVPNGAWCLFRMEPKGTRQGKVVVAQHRSIDDPDMGGTFTIKVYGSEKEKGEDGEWEHSRIVLKPDSDIADFKPLIFSSSDAGSLKIVAELISVIDTEALRSPEN